VWQDYDPEESHGGAVALQLVGRRFEEEKVVKMLGAVTKALSE
jgi:amidase